LVAVLLSGARTEDSGASCAATARWGGTLYIGSALTRDGKLQLGGRLGRARIPACIDTDPPPPDERDRFDPIRRIRGVPPALGFYDTLTRTIFRAQGYFASLPSHPLHDLLFAGSEDDRRGARCRRPVRRRGRVTEITLGSGFLLRSKGARMQLQVSERSQIHGFERHGHPYLQAGDRISVLVQRCILRDRTAVRDAVEVWPAA
jgi:hypothetical protein